MQTHGGAPAEAAITSRERKFRADIRVDWNKDGLYSHALSNLSGFISTASVDRSLRGSAPEEILLIEGASAAELEFTVHGKHNGLAFDTIFSPYQGLSPFYQQNIVGAEVTYNIGVETSIGVVWYQQFVGNVRTITPNRADGTVIITALDRVELLRRPVRFPAWAISEYHANRGFVDAQLCNSQWVIDHCLRMSDVSPTPYRPADVYTEVYGTPESPFPFDLGGQVWVSGTGSWQPSIGWPDRALTQFFPATESGGPNMFDKFGSAHPSSPEPENPPLCLTANAGASGRTLNYWAADRAIDWQATHVFGFTLITRGTNGAYYKTAATHDVLTVRLGFNLSLIIRIGGGNVWTVLVKDSGVSSSASYTLPLSGDYVRIWAAWQLGNWPSGGDTQCMIKVGTGGSTSWQVVSSAYSGPFPDDNSAGQVQVVHNVGINDAFYTTAPNNGLSPYNVFGNTAPTGKPAKYVAVLDEGLNRASYMPTRSNSDAWDIITQVAAAEFGSVFWDEEGVFRFWNYERIRALQETIVRTLTLDEITGLQITNSLDSVRNIWSVEARQRRSISDQIVYLAGSGDEFYVDGNSTARYTIWVDDVLALDLGPIRRFTSTVGHPTIFEWDEDLVVHGYVVQWLISGTWQEADARVGLTVAAAKIDANGYLAIELGNSYAEPARLVRTGGQPALKLAGDRIKDGAPQTFIHKDQVSVNEFGPRNLPLSGDWFQDQYNAAEMVDTLLPRTVVPAPTTDAITIAGDPRLQLGDTVGLRDDEGFGRLASVQIYGIRREFDKDNGLTDTLTVEMIAPSGLGIWDDPVYGLWDDTFVWSE